jgi:hypothetical protein
MIFIEMRPTRRLESDLPVDLEQCCHWQLYQALCKDCKSINVAKSALDQEVRHRTIHQAEISNWLE